jgi:hypothetical protein
VLRQPPEHRAAPDVPKDRCAVVAGRCQKCAIGEKDTATTGALWPVRRTSCGVPAGGAGGTGSRNRGNGRAPVAGARRVALLDWVRYRKGERQAPPPPQSVAHPECGRSGPFRLPVSAVAQVGREPPPCRCPCSWGGFGPAGLVSEVTRLPANSIILTFRHLGHAAQTDCPRSPGAAVSMAVVAWNSGRPAAPTRASVADAGPVLPWYRCR